MTIQERNVEILNFIKENPINLGTPNCYKEVCDKFFVNTDVIRGILRRNPNFKESLRLGTPNLDKVIDKSKEQVLDFPISTEVSENLITGAKEISKKIDYQIKGVDELIAELQIDTSKYDVIKWKCSTWQSPKKGDNPTQLYAVNCELKPKQVDGRFDLLEAFREIVSKVPSKYDFSKSPSSYTGKSLFIYLSDTHVGASVSEDSLYENEYSATIFARRLDEVLDNVYKLYTLHGTFENIYVVNLGDCIDGFNNQTARGGHFLPQNLSNKQQFEVYFQSMKEFFEDIIEENFTQTLHFISVGDSNHAGALEYVLNRAIEIYLNASYPQVQTRVFNKFIEHLQLGNNTFIFMHGKDSEAMKHGLPLILNDKTEVFLNDYIYQNDIKTKNIYVVKGDLHQSAHQWGKRFKYINVLSLFGSSKWIHTNFGSGRAGVEFQIVDSQGTFSIQEEIYF
jgi:hypothetical protein